MLNLIETRNRHFIARCRQLIAALPKGSLVNRAEIARQAAMSPAPCYYCTHEYALRMLRVLRHGHLQLRRDRRLAMWEEINEKVTALQARRPDMSLPLALTHILSSATASQFFISPSTALSLAERLR